MYDMILKNGHVIDPANERDGIMDVALNDGKIARVAPDIASEEGEKILDLKGCYIIPGIIDIHAHCYPMLPLPKTMIPTINADAHMLRAGVTTTVDAGTVGWRHFVDFKRSVIDRSVVRVLAFLNIAAGGMVEMESEQTLADLQPGICAEVIKAFPEHLVGVKTAHYWGSKPFDDLHPSWGSVDKTIEAGELAGKPVMVDFQPNRHGNSYRDLITKKMRPKDIHTHVFAQQFPIVDENCKVYDHMWEAREKGIFFDLGHGAGSFWFRNAVPAFNDGFSIDTISTDLHMANIYGSVLSMLNIMSKMLNIGMPLQEVIMRSTSEPARLINRPDLGNLSEGACADIAVLELNEGDYNYIDCGRARMNGTSALNCLMTFREGKIVFDYTGISMPEWQDAPESYWNCPSLFL
ncbi:MAG: amidohydrolase/deacetylase family metallohydrolase [Clostridia bacterium]|nr:amidohydrolase/deacetylase family metallohydrolase [Clostridia bacterium]